MSNHALHVSDQTGGLEAAAFQLQLRRLESLQTLMTQGGAVVSEVAAFLARAREELKALQREQEQYVETQRHAAEEKAELIAKLTHATKAADESTVRAMELEAKVNQLTQELTSNSDRVAREELEAERRKAAAQQATSADRIARLEAALRHESELRTLTVGKIRQEEASLYATELALLKNRLTALEHQLESERERRARLMEVVKTHEVTVNAQKQRETV